MQSFFSAHGFIPCAILAREIRLHTLNATLFFQADKARTATGTQLGSQLKSRVPDRNQSTRTMPQRKTFLPGSIHTDDRHMIPRGWSQTDTPFQRIAQFKHRTGSRQKLAVMRVTRLRGGG
jgi:hypothetical protein